MQAVLGSIGPRQEEQEGWAKDWAVGAAPSEHKLLNAALSLDYEAVDDLMTHGTPHAAAEGGPAAMQRAAAGGHAAAARTLLSAGVDPNAADLHGGQPLHIAAAVGSKPCLQVLLPAGANLEGCRCVVSMRPGTGQ